MSKDPLKISGIHDGAPRSIFANARKLRENMTEAETLLWEHLKKKPFGLKFRRQHPINYFILDFYCHKERLSIELDGPYHLDEEQKEKDKERTNYLKGVGIRELRFKNQLIINDFDLVIKTIFDEI
jgi:very-short-patch-repair endonuclease